MGTPKSSFSDAESGIPTSAQVLVPPREPLIIADSADAEAPVSPIESTKNATNPHDWPRRKKWLAVTLASLYTFISPIASSMVAPALPYISRDLGFSEVIEVEMVLSVFVLAYAIGPLILAPLSEIYGRYKILQASMWVFIIFNTACALAQTKEQLLIFRFFAGLGGSAPITIAGSVVSDCFNVHEMGAAMSYYALGIIVAPALGPIIGGFTTQGTNWHWVFYVCSIAAGILAIIGTFLLPETYRPYLEQLERKKHNLSGPVSGPEVGVLSKLGPAIMRPFIMLGTQPIVQAIALHMAFVYGVMYIVLTTFSELFVTKYGEETSISTLHYLALGFGFLIGNRVAGKLVDLSSEYLQKRFSTGHKPEYRLPITIPAAILFPVGLFLYGWSAEYAYHWIVPDIGIMIFSFSVNVVFQALTVYTVDVYMRYSASALAAVGFLRALAGFGFPLFSESMYDQLGYGWGNSVLAFVGIGLGIPAPILLYVYGERIRAKSQFGSG
ncbi:hypothetical protein HDU83_005652 [Entophlyctis luteolus]|nr:hypothetical protein HDU82_008926 [Entophlyctis luteolus]KAJ3354268.1 hypothetical protein HDU83_005652 [Entophlyctis luteolus]KAJ3388051.1 hypothetical protein HDU84_000294 [Entophlyctis sp. JEL0112]